MIYKDDKHKAIYEEICEQMRYIDTYHQALAYLISVDNVCRQHIGDIYDVSTDGIMLNAISKGWQTSTSAKTTRLAFNLWNGLAADISEDGEEHNGAMYTVAEIFDSPYAKYYWQAIKLRYQYPAEEAEEGDVEEWKQTGN